MSHLDTHEMQLYTFMLCCPMLKPDELWSLILGWLPFRVLGWELRYVFSIDRLIDPLY
jgi:hypothetical protein